MASQDSDSPGQGNQGMSQLGLSAHDVLARRAEFGPNQLPGEAGVSIWKILLNQLKSPLVYIILVAAGVSLSLGEFGDFGIIMVVVVVDVILGLIQEYKAQKTYVALKGLLHPTTTVIRDGQRIEVEVWELVPDDLVVLSAGEKVPADGLLTESTQLMLDESILTGENEPVGKQAAFQPTANDSGSRVFMGTTVVTGRGIFKVSQTGQSTELGQIAASLKAQAEEDTPFQIRLKAFSKILTRVVVGFTALILVVGLVMGREFLDMLRTAIILAIAAVPEGLLIAVTVILVLGMRKILKRQGLVKKLLAVETLGSVTVICTDKTGTLTEGRMRVSRTRLDDEPTALQAMVLCNNLEGPVDAVLWSYAEQKMPVSPQDLIAKTRRLSEELFTSDSKRMLAEVTDGPFGTESVCFAKGAPEIILAMCSLPALRHQAVSTEVDTWAGEGLRLIGLACRKGGRLEDPMGYTWLGLVGMEDPIRESVPDSIRAARNAGIQIKMITGDYRLTAEWIARETGLADGQCQVLEGEEIASLSDTELQEKVKWAAVFARIRPRDKLRIVQALQANGEICAMIGDGVNDAPALKRANIGVVVGSATDVAKETADLILLDNSFSTIVAAIEEGRIIFANIRKVVAYTLSNSFAEVLTIFTAMILRWPAPLTVAQILWIHLICDGPSDIVLGFEPKEDGIMAEKPRPLKDPILTRLAFILIGVISIASTVFTLILFRHFYQVHQSEVEGRSIVFASFAINSMVYIFAYRSLRIPLFKMNRLIANKPLILAVAGGILTALIAFWIPGLRSLLGLVPLTWVEWALVIGFALLLLIIVEIGKVIANHFAKR